MCCGSGIGGYAAVGGRLSLSIDRNDVITLEETITTDVTPKWNVSHSTYTLELPPDGLRITGDVTTTNGNVNSTQTFRLQGTFKYWVEEGTPVLIEKKTALIDVFLGYGDFRFGSPTATGIFGPVRTPFAGSSLPKVMVQRCSRPREGCGRLADGNAPCTLWPPCP